MSNEDFPTKIGDHRPPTWNEVERILQDLSKLLSLWDGSIANQLPSPADKREFLAVMANFMDRIEKLQSEYYDLVESVEFKMQMIKSHPGAYTLDPEFKRTVEIMKSLPDVKKKWYKHKKPFR
ncbi:MAG: hypothetical protein Q7S69_05920 [Nitrosomonadaceae bacterium]|nr:hypothetical protein [Nitrosomonadaceae bacterium]